uniref:Uncharacterized protein n=1 Tax=Sesuvium portulacastrum TaxID=221166 RepID=A0A6B9MAR1_SESPO|nr:hypothetical protein [Sesuvium portulacastrum]
MKEKEKFFISNRTLSIKNFKMRKSSMKILFAAILSICALSSKKLSIVYWGDSWVFPPSIALFLILCVLILKWILPKKVESTVIRLALLFVFSFLLLDLRVWVFGLISSVILGNFALFVQPASGSSIGSTSSARPGDFQTLGAEPSVASNESRVLGPKLDVEEATSSHPPLPQAQGEEEEPLRRIQIPRNLRGPAFDQALKNELDDMITQAMDSYLSRHRAQILLEFPRASGLDSLTLLSKLKDEVLADYGLDSARGSKELRDLEKVMLQDIGRSRDTYKNNVFHRALTVFLNDQR